MKDVMITMYNFVAKNDLTVAAEMMIDYFKNHSNERLNEAVLISRELYAIIDATKTGMISWKDENIAKNQVAQRMLHLIQDM